ncbi:MAG: hypothetical protein QOE03_42 [Micromonosporaceae bacterium]|jgi:hypothetical protein|nr:hypothetical protein [Micromonosporaceae bacterium]
MVGSDGVAGVDGDGHLRDGVRVAGKTTPAQPIDLTSPRNAAPRRSLPTGLLAVVGVVAVVVGTVAVVQHRGASAKAPTAAAPASSASAPQFITGVDWQNATAVYPAQFNQGYCVDGSVTFRQGTATNGGNTLKILNAPAAVYGDLTGDGRPEAVLEGQCTSSEGTGHPDLVIITQATDGTLRQIDFIDPNDGLTGDLSGAQIQSVQVVRGRLVVVIGAENGRTRTRTYEWNGTAMRTISG